MNQRNQPSEPSSNDSDQQEEPSPTDDRSDDHADSRWWSRVLPGEGVAVVLAFLWLFCLLLGYFMIRPVRETMGTLVGTQSLQYLFLASFAVMVVAVPIYSALVARLPRRWLVRVVFHFFALCLLAFAFAMESQSTSVATWTAYIFFVWVSVFGVFATSVFWSVLADMFSNAQGKRLFGFIAAGGTAGAISGSLLASQLSTLVSMQTLLLFPMVLIELGLICAWRLEHQSMAVQRADHRKSDDASQRPTGGGLLAGITHVMGSPYLALICLFLFFVQACGTQLYFEQAVIVDQAIESNDERTRLFAYLDLGAQLLTLVVQVGLSGVVMRRAGVAVALVSLPVIYATGFASLAASPSLGVLVVIVIAARAAGYGIAVPAREVLFTVVSREDKYKSKNFIDTVVLRGGDALSGQIFGSLRGLGLGLSVMNLLALPATILWAVVAWKLGRRQRVLAHHGLTMPVPGNSQR